MKYAIGSNGSKKKARYGSSWNVFCGFLFVVTVMIGVSLYFKGEALSKKALANVPGLTFNHIAKQAEAATKSAELTPTPYIDPKQAIINKYPHSDILSRIHFLESTNGTAAHGYHRGCEAKGQSNEFGYGVWSHVCFSDFEASVKRVSARIDELLQTHSLGETLCMYNLGQAVNDCEYAMNFLAK